MSQVKLEDALRVVSVNRDEFAGHGFESWLARNWAVYKMFEKLALDVAARGYRHYGAKTIWEVMRFHMDAQEQGGGRYKLNNNYHAACARLFARLNPEQHALFSFRQAQRSMWYR